jgi:hypothetical protein
VCARLWWLLPKIIARSWHMQLKLGCVIARNDSNDVVWFEAMDDGGNPIPVLIDEVVLDTVFVRHIDPGEVTLGRIRLEPGQSVQMTTPIASVGLHTGDQVGANDMMFGVRVVPDGRAPGVVYARTLRFGETDDGRRVHVRPGESLTLKPGALRAELDAIDEFYRKVDPARPEGSLATALRVWFGIGNGHVPEIVMLTSAAAYRLDAAHHLLHHAEIARSSLVQANELPAAKQAAKTDELIHLVQEGIVALARCIALVESGIDQSSYYVPLPTVMAANRVAIKDIRDAYEHIDERALGRVGIKRVVDERSYMIFDHRPLVTNGQIEYFDHRLAISDLPELLEACRTTIKVLAGGAP